jgi:hypothetical protein
LLKYLYVSLFIFISYRSALNDNENYVWPWIDSAVEARVGLLEFSAGLSLFFFWEFSTEMGCFPCFRSSKKKKKPSKPSKPLKPSKDDSKTGQSAASSTHQPAKDPPDSLKSKPSFDSRKEVSRDGSQHIAAQTFTFRELAAATKNFRPECLLGEGGFGRVYRGRLESTGQAVAVKQLDRNGVQGNREFLVEVLMLSLLHHDNLVNLIGYCADGDQRLLVYEYMPLGSLEDHLHGIDISKPPYFG